MLHAHRNSGSKAGRAPIRTIATLTLAASIAGCAAGPDFERPAPPTTTQYTTTPVPNQTESAPVRFGEAQRIVSGGPVEAEWWRSLGSPRLDALIETALAANPTLAAARATLRQAQELEAARAGSTRYPQVDAGVGARRQRLSPSTLGIAGEPREFSLYDAGVDVHYELDLAGGNRRELEALAAQVDYRRYELEAARQALVGNVAAAAITRARLAAQIAASDAILLGQEDQLQLARERVRLGNAAPDEVLALQTVVEQTRAELPVLRRQMQHTDHLLAVLAGQTPDAGGIPEFTLDDFTLPSELPLLVPSELVRHRPDIRASEALLHQANAEYGAAVARLYPQLDLSASLGSQALSSGALFGSGSAVWSIVGQLSQPLFNASLPAEKRAALAAFDAAAAHYQGVVLEALRNVADTLRAVENDALVLAALAAADEAARGSLRAVEQRYLHGAASYVELLIAQQQAQRTRLDLAGAQAQRLADSVALYLAIGAGWSEREPG